MLGLHVPCMQVPACVFEKFLQNDRGDSNENN